MSTGTTRVRYVPLEQRRRQQGGDEYAARRALFLQSYRFSVDARRRGEEDDDEERSLRGRLARRLRAAVARARGWCVGAGMVSRAWRPRADPLLGCFGAGHRHRHHKYYLHDYA